MSADASNSFSQIFVFLKSSFSSVLSWLDNIYLLPNLSILDLHIALIVFAILFTAVFSVVRSGVNNSIGSVADSRKEAAARAKAESYETYANNRSRLKAYGRAWDEGHR